MNNIIQMLVYRVRGLRDEVIAHFRIKKMDRATRPALESLCAVEFVNGVATTYPQRQSFLSMYCLDEWYRNTDPEALKAMVTLLPRDSSSGTGATYKKVEDPSRRQGMVNGQVQQCSGLCPNIVAIATNSNVGLPFTFHCIFPRLTWSVAQPQDRLAAEATKSLMCVWNIQTPGAQPVDDLLAVVLMVMKKRKRIDYQLTDSNGSSSTPDDPVLASHLADILTVVPMVCKQQVGLFSLHPCVCSDSISAQLGLMNKTGLVTYEICRVVKTYMDWFLQFFKRMFRDCLGQTLMMSFDRQTGIQTTRAVASCLQTTVLAHMRRPDTTYNQVITHPPTHPPTNPPTHPPTHPH